MSSQDMKEKCGCPIEMPGNSSHDGRAWWEVPLGLHGWRRGWKDDTVKKVPRERWPGKTQRQG